MKTNFLFTLLCFGVLSWTGCFSDDDGLFNCEKGEGDVVTESFELDSFEGIDLEINADVFLTQADFFAIEVDGQSNIINELDFDIDNNILEIDFHGCVRNHTKLVFRITMPKVETLKINGSGNITSSNFITTSDIQLRISGSGDMDLGLTTEDVEANISGSGKMVLEGVAERFESKISGSGDIRAFDLITEKADLKISGSGDMEIHVTDRLDVKISGSGDVYYHGNPLLDVDISGSGDVVDAN